MAAAALLLPAALFGQRPGKFTGQIRTYYIAADTVSWDYAPGGRDGITGKPLVDSAFFAKEPPRPVSTVYKKILYREYTDGSFRVLKPRPANWEHLGFLGPLIRAEVGDTIRITFRNNSGFPATMHPHGVFYDKDSEGSPYQDGTSGPKKADDGVPPGGTHVYVWAVPERAGPGPMDGSSVMWMYHSHADETRDVNSGLLGVMIVTARGMARPDGSPKDVDRELIATFAQVHEEDSWLAKDNIPAAFLVPPPNGPIPNPSAPHWHGNVVSIAHMRADVGIILPMSMLIADMTPDNQGIWLFHCHITFHNAAGMTSRYRVE